MEFLGPPEHEDRIERWRKEARPGPQEDDTVLALFVCCLSLLRSLTEQMQTARRDMNNLRRCQDMLQLWAHQYGVHDRTLTATLEKSTSLRQAILELLVPLCGVLLRGISSHILPHTNRDGAKAQYDDALRIYQQTKWQVLDNQSSSDSEAAYNDLKAQFEPVTMVLLVRKTRIYTECLTDLGSSLQSPAPDDLEEGIAIGLVLEQRSAEDYHTELLKAKFPLARLDILQRLGRTSWDRYQRMQQERDKNAQRQTIIASDSKSHAGCSEFQDSGLGTSVPASASSYAATVVSVMSSIAGGKIAQIPQLPAGARAGAQFECTACGRLIRVTDDREWRKHLYADLKPYACFFVGCALNGECFGTLQLWGAHLELEHDFGPDWCALSCPFCLEAIESGKKAILSHLAQHMEDVAIAAIPRDVDSDAASDSEPDNPSLLGLEDERPQEDSRKLEDLGGLAKMDILQASATASLSQEHFAEAEEMFRQLVEIQAVTLAEEHPVRLSNLQNLASSLKAQHKYTEAEQLFRRVFETRKCLLIEDHPTAMDDLRSLANVVLVQGRFNEAERMFRRWLDLAKNNISGPTTGEVLTCTRSMAFIKENLGSFEEAEQLYRMVLARQEDLLGKTHPETRRTAESLLHFSCRQRSTPEGPGAGSSLPQTKESLHPDSVALKLSAPTSSALSTSISPSAVTPPRSHDAYDSLPFPCSDPFAILGHEVSDQFDHKDSSTALETVGTDKQRLSKATDISKGVNVPAQKFESSSSILAPDLGTVCPADIETGTRTDTNSTHDVTASSQTIAEFESDLANFDFDSFLRDNDDSYSLANFACDSNSLYPQSDKEQTRSTWNTTPRSKVRISNTTDRITLSGILKCNKCRRDRQRCIPTGDQPEECERCRRFGHACSGFTPSRRAKKLTTDGKAGTQAESSTLEGPETHRKSSSALVEQIRKRRAASKEDKQAEPSKPKFPSAASPVSAPDHGSYFGISMGPNLPTDPSAPSASHIPNTNTFPTVAKYKRFRVESNQYQDAHIFVSVY